MSILRRRAFYSAKGGQIKFLDWAHTTTTLGVMAEPFMINDRHEKNSNYADFDPSDIMVQVHEMTPVEDEGDLKNKLSGSPAAGPPLHGGNMSPRVFIFTGDNRGST